MNSTQHCCLLLTWTTLTWMFSAKAVKMGACKGGCACCSCVTLSLSTLFLLVSTASLVLIYVLIAGETNKGVNTHTHTQISNCRDWWQISQSFVLMPGPDPTLPQNYTYMVGVGRADCTGPPAEIPLVSTGTAANRTLLTAHSTTTKSVKKISHLKDTVSGGMLLPRVVTCSYWCKPKQHIRRRRREW